MAFDTFEIQYNNLRQALGSAQEPGPNGVLYVNATTFPPFAGGVINRYTFQFVEGDGGTLTIEVQGPSGAWSRYTNAEGVEATAIGVNDAYIVDTGVWSGFRCTFAGTDGSAVLSVLGWTASDTVPELTAQLDALQTEVDELIAGNWSRRQPNLPIEITNTGVATTPFVTTGWLDVPAPVNSNLDLSAWVDLDMVDGTQACFVQMTVEPIGGAVVVVAGSALPITGPFTGTVRLEAQIQVLDASSTGSIEWHYTTKGGEIGNPLIVDDEDFGAESGTIDLDPATLRLNVQIDATAGWTADKSTATLRLLRLDYTGA